MSDKLINRGSKTNSYYDTSKLITVPVGKSVQSIIDKAVQDGASITNSYIIFANKYALLDWEYPLPPGIQVILTDANNKGGLPSRIPYKTHLVTIMLCRASKDYFEVPAGAEYGVGISPAAYLMDKGIPVTHAVLGGHMGQSDSYGDVKPTMSLNELRLANWVKGDSIVSGTKDASYGDDRLPDNFADSVLLDKQRIESFDAPLHGVTPPTGFVQPSVTYIASPSPNAVTPFDFSPLGLVCNGYSEAGFGTRPYGEPYHRAYDDSYNMTSGEVMEHANGWYRQGLQSAYQYGWIHGHDLPNGNIAAQDNFTMYHSLKYQATTESPRKWEECGRTLFCVENISTITHAVFKQIIDTFVADRAAGLLDFVSLDTLINGIREEGPSNTITGEILTVSSDKGTLKRSPKNIIAVHGTVGAASTIFRIVPSARTLATGEVKVNYPTGELTFYSADDPTDVTVDYVPQPAWGGLKQWNFADMPDEQILMANAATDQRKYGIYQPVYGGEHGGVINADKTLTLNASNLREIWIKPSIVSGKSFMLRIKANSANAGVLKVRFWYTVSTLNPDVPSTATQYEVSVPQTVQLEQSVRSIGSTDAYYYFPIGIPSYIPALELRIYATSNIVNIKSIEWAIC